MCVPSLIIPDEPSRANSIARGMGDISRDVGSERSKWVDDAVGGYMHSFPLDAALKKHAAVILSRIVNFELRHRRARGKEEDLIEIAARFSNLDERRLPKC